MKSALLVNLMPTHTNSIEKPVVMVVDDSMDDRMIVQMAFRKTAPQMDFRAFDNGAEAVAYISGAGKYLDRIAYPMPILLLLDLKMPRLTGFDVYQLFQKFKMLNAPSSAF